MMNEIITKKCRVCGAEKPIEDFHKCKTKQYGVCGICKQCACAEKRAKYLLNPQHFKDIGARSRAKHPTVKTEYNLSYRLANADKLNEYHAAYREAHRAKAKEVSRVWRKNNTERYRAHLRSRYAQNAEKYREAARMNRILNPQKAHEQDVRHSCRRRAMKHKNGGTISATEWRRLKERYNYTCLRCGKSEPEIRLTIDRVVPLSLGGANTIENAQPLCQSCNSTKRIKATDYRIEYLKGKR